MINVDVFFGGKNYHLKLKTDDTIKTLIKEVKIKAGYRNIVKYCVSGRYIKGSGRL